MTDIATLIMDLFMFELIDEKLCHIIKDTIKQKCPGEYDIKVSLYKDNSIKILFIFENSEDAVAFKLRYGTGIEYTLTRT